MEISQVNIALFIDFENFGSHRALDVGGLTSELRGRGRLLIKRAYADWGRFSSQKRKMLEHAVDLTELPEHGNKGKNSADIKLVVDALEVAFTMPHVDTFVVASSDSDFTPLFSKLREWGRTVIVAGSRADMNALVKAHCDEVIYLESAPQAAKAVPHPKLPLATMRLFRKALDHLGEKGIKTRGSQIKTAMRELQPQFDEAAVGFKRFKDVAAAFVKADPGFVMLPDGESDYVVVSGDALAIAPQDAAQPVSLPAHLRTPPAPLELERLVSQVLADGPIAMGELARALKTEHFADDAGISVTGLRRHLQNLVQSGFLGHTAVGEQHALCLALDMQPTAAEG